MDIVRCDNCGKMVPYHGDVCPYCKADKAAGKRLVNIAAGFGVAGAIVAMAWAKIATEAPFPVDFCFGFAGAVVGILIGGLVVGLSKLRK